MFQGSQKGVSRTFQESFKGVSRKFEGCFMIFKGISRVSRKFQESFMLHGTHRSFPSRRRAC